MKTEREKISCKIGERIRRFRTEQHLSQEALALSCEIHPAYLGRLERGEKCPKAAINRIENAIYSLSEGEALEIAEIIERLISFKHDNT